MPQAKGGRCAQMCFYGTKSQPALRAIAVSVHSYSIQNYHNDPISRLVGLGGWTDGLMD